MATQFDGVMTPVNSSSIAAVGYDNGRRTLLIRFKGGAVHLYHGVRPEQHAQLLSADTASRYFAKHIRNEFRATKL